MISLTTFLMYSYKVCCLSVCLSVCLHTNGRVSVQERDYTSNAENLSYLANNTDISDSLSSISLSTLSEDKPFPRRVWNESERLPSCIIPRPSTAKKSDPLKTLKKYENTWNHHAVPGEKRHTALRSAIRRQMAECDVQPFVAPQRDVYVNRYEPVVAYFDTCIQKIKETRPKNKRNLFGTPVAFFRYLVLREMHPLSDSDYGCVSRSAKYRKKATGVPNKFLLFFGLVIGHLFPAPPWTPWRHSRLVRSPHTRCLCHQLLSRVGHAKSKLFKTRYLGHVDWLSANQGPVFPDSVGSCHFLYLLCTAERGGCDTKSCQDLFSKGWTQQVLFRPMLLPCGSRSNAQNEEPTETTNQNSLFRSRDWLSSIQGPVFPESVTSWLEIEPFLNKKLEIRTQLISEYIPWYRSNPASFKTTKVGCRDMWRSSQLCGCSTQLNWCN
eukprot:sb/3464785/